ncbi:unnamed protein product [Ilex paraguariensis]|uniref:Uncharacterized protein n=1 Tax=Ilex paraguariensis TaxID=185542 RepID=A0ABC8UXM9_9AQUA
MLSNPSPAASFGFDTSTGSLPVYIGYVTVDPKAGRALFYYFVESPQNSSTKPLVLFIGGAPMCSSLGIGAMMELGPFKVHEDGKTLYRNGYAWNSEANIIFLEFPAGVGFSYSNRTSDYDLNGETVRDSFTWRDFLNTRLEISLL